MISAYACQTLCTSSNYDVATNISVAGMPRPACRSVLIQLTETYEQAQNVAGHSLLKMQYERRTAILIQCSSYIFDALCWEKAGPITRHGSSNHGRVAIKFGVALYEPLTK